MHIEQYLTNKLNVYKTISCHENGLRWIRFLDENDGEAYGENGQIDEVQSGHGGKVERD